MPWRYHAAHSTRSSITSGRPASVIQALPIICPSSCAKEPKATESKMTKSAASPTRFDAPPGRDQVPPLEWCLDEKVEALYQQYSGAHSREVEPEVIELHNSLV